MFNANVCPGTYDRRQKARDQMRRLRLEQKAQIGRCKLLAATNLQRGERIVDLATTEHEQTTIDLLLSRMRMQDKTFSQHVYKAGPKHEAQAIKEDGHVLSSEEIHCQDPSRQQSEPIEGDFHRYTTSHSTVVHP